jgi:hypothetical protein
MRYAIILAAGLAALSAGAAAQSSADDMPQVPMPPKPGLATPPEGWAYLPELAIFGPADIYQRRLSVPGGPGVDTGPLVQMQVHTKRNVGILTRDVAVPLTADTRLNWRWKVDMLPSAVAEDVVPHHDYLSIAVKFENGRDITYMWSSALENEKGFECPLPDWKGREWHVVVRSGDADLGKWLAEERNVLADYAKHIGGKAPGRIVQVWLISNSIIQQTEGKAAYGDIFLTGGEGTGPVRVF